MVVVDVLPEEDDLARPRVDRLTALGHHVVDGDMAFASPDPRDDAERAVVVTALDHPHEVAHARPARRWKRFAHRVVVPSLELRDEGVVLADGHHSVDDLGKSLAKLIALLGDNAAGDGHRPLRSLPWPELVQLGVDAVL